MRLSLLAVTLVAACSDPVGPRPLEYDLGTCGRVEILPEEGGLHRPQGTVIEWPTNPPTSGDHYGIWAAWDRSYPALERAYWVHNLEHGGLVLAYNCPEGCPDDIAALEDAVRSLPDDPACVAPVRHRAIVVADPLLPSRFAVIAWGTLYTATCVDAEAIRIFARDFYGTAPEDFCTEGASLGGTFIE